jgi:hypothetical protein
MTGKKKRPYRTPSIRTEKIFERRALACGKVQRVGIAPPPCRGNFKQS